ncbi:MAG: DUF418 domain-containing protein [Ectothiorhodospiraceae bacterium]|nr:DUF418 domain-containing protein [Ectothiorhodospiraceae bacterium]
MSVGTSRREQPGTDATTAGRLPALDVLRGVAILGILLMNIQSFGLVSSAYANPKALGEPPMLDWLVWMVNHVVADEKFLSMLTILFGAGFLLMAQRFQGGAGEFERRFRRRMAWLFVFGAVHALLIWPGDILAAYAVCGLIIIRLRRWSNADLLALALLLFTAVMVLWMLASAVLAFILPPEQLKQLISVYWSPSSDVVKEEVERLTHGWLSAFGDRALHAAGAQLWMFGSDRFWRMTALMLLGMVLLRTGFLTGGWSTRAYATVALLGLALGVPLALLGVWFNEAVGWDFRYAMFLGRIPNHWGSVAMALAWIALVLMLVRSGVLARLRLALSAVGRLAMTNYLNQSFISAAIFYGFGLGLFAQLGHAGLMGVVVLIWAFQIAFSLVWQRYLGAGPFERAWRWLPQPRRSTQAGGAA